MFKYKLSNFWQKELDRFAYESYDGMNCAGSILNELAVKFGKTDETCKLVQVPPGCLVMQFVYSVFPQYLSCLSINSTHVFRFYFFGTALNWFALKICCSNIIKNFSKSNIRICNDFNGHDDVVCVTHVDATSLLAHRCYGLLLCPLKSDSFVTDTRRASFWTKSQLTHTQLHFLVGLFLWRKLTKTWSYI